jgi:hypothetical protein
MKQKKFGFRNGACAPWWVSWAGDRGESWLERVLQEIEQTLIGPMTAMQTS